MQEDTKFDGILMTLLQQRGNIDLFFDSVYGFLRRNTDFFANQTKAQQIIVNNCKTNFVKYNEQKQKEQEKEQKKKQEAEKKKNTPVARPEPKKVEVAPVVKQEIKEQVKQGGEKKDDNQPAPKGNGGRTDKYIWTQTLENLEMFIFLDEAVTKKNVKVTIAMDKLTLLVNGQPLIDGKWKDKINSDDTYWTIQSGQIEDYTGKYMHINIQKWKNQTSWWSTPIQGHVQINTQKINPEPSKLSDLDGQTRSTVEKMMFDMRQKQQGLPSSDELQKQEKLKEFMKAHPEMDFSNCKFN